MPVQVVCLGSSSIFLWSSFLSIRRKVDSEPGNSNLTLKDLTGFNGRCDAIYFTTEKEQLPPNETVQLTDFRKKMLDIPAEPEQYSYDVIVTGGGIAGMCAAATASRLGCKVALINDRPVLGGNNSSEVRVHLGCNIGVGPNSGLGRMIRQFGHSKEGMPNLPQTMKMKRRSFLSPMKRIINFHSF